jgi:hypothetical protein
MSAREKLHELIDRLADAELRGALQALESLPGARQDASLQRAQAIATPDDKPLSAEEQAVVDHAFKEATRGETTPWEQIRVCLAGPSN